MAALVRSVPSERGDLMHLSRALLMAVLSLALA